LSEVEPVYLQGAAAFSVHGSEHPAVAAQGAGVLGDAASASWYLGVGG
jgi:hypothetical protein